MEASTTSNLVTLLRNMAAAKPAAIAPTIVPVSRVRVFTFPRSELVSECIVRRLST